MKQYIFRRLLWLIPIMILISVISFVLMYLSPGDPAVIFLSKGGDVPNQAAIEAMREKLGLNEPVWRQYLYWITDILHGDFGESISNGKPVLGEIMRCFPNTLKLTLSSIALTLLISIPLGILAAVNENRAADNIIRAASFINSSMPGFFVALILIYTLSVKFRWFPTISTGSAKGIVLPTLSLAICLSASYIRQIRAAIVKEMGEDYIRMIRARGIKERSILLSSALKSTLPAILTIAGMNIGHLLGGTAIIETVFTYPGVGRLAVESITDRDYPMIQGYVLMMAVIYVLINLVVDLLHAYADPRVRRRIQIENRRSHRQVYEKKKADLS
jgi:ABC-type dipeptide/oligopeptide/nickel transport system permease component